MHRPAGDGEEDTPLLFVVDDDQATLDILSEVADEAGWAAHGFRRLHDMQASLQRSRPTLLILDDDLPDGSGGDLAREMRSDPELNEVPLVVCTGAHARRRAEIGCWAPVIAKPFRLDEIEPFLASAHRRQRRVAGRQAAS